MDAITSKLGNRENREGINKIFDLFDDDGSNSINLNNLKRVIYYEIDLIFRLPKNWVRQWQQNS